MFIFCTSRRGLGHVRKPFLSPTDIQSRLIANQRCCPGEEANITPGLPWNLLNVLAVIFRCPSLCPFRPPRGAISFPTTSVPALPPSPSPPLLPLSFLTSYVSRRPQLFLISHCSLMYGTTIHCSMPLHGLCEFLHLLPYIRANRPS